MPSRVATAPPSRKPRASTPATRSAPEAISASASVTAASPSGIGQHRREVLELNAGLGKVGHLAGQRRDDSADVGLLRASLIVRLSTHRSMFQPAPQRVGLLLTANIFFDVISVRC